MNRLPLTVTKGLTPGESSGVQGAGDGTGVGAEVRPAPQPVRSSAAARVGAASLKDRDPLFIFYLQPR
jgi:hypothetical protein